MFTEEFLKNNPEFTKGWPQEINNCPSMTEPDQSLRVSDLYNRFINGTAPNVQFSPESGKDESFNDIIPSGIDVFEAAAICADFDARIKSYIDEQKARNLEATERKELERLMKKYNNSSSEDFNKSAEATE